jgi:glycosyltransferase involved in cell wall biosynthesis
LEQIKKHIVFSVTNDLSYDQRMIRICNTLIKAGFNITLVGRKRKNSAPLSSANFTQKRLFCFFEKGPFFYAEFNLRLFFFLLFTRANMYVAIDWDTLVANTLAAIIKSKKLGIDSHEYFTEVPELSSRSMVKSIWKHIGKICVPLANIRYTVSYSIAKALEADYLVPFDVVRNMPYKQAYINEATQKAIIYQGDLNEGRGIELAIRAITHIDAELWIAGDGPMRGELELLATQLNVSHKVVFKGYLNADELHALTSKALLGINLLKPESRSYYLSLTNKFFNHVQAGIPQVCSNFPEYIYLNKKHQVCIYSEYSSTDLAFQINNLLADTQAYKRLKSNSLIAAEEWIWENEKQILISLYEQAFAHSKF